MKRIKKVSQTVPTYGQIVDGYSDSTTDGYSANYQNEHNIVVKSEQPTTNEKVWFAKSKNLFDKNNIYVLNAYITTENGVITSDSTSKTVYIKIKPSITYTVSKIASERFKIATYSSLPIIGSTSNNVVGDNSATSLTITSGTNDNYLAVWLYYSSGDTATFQQIIDTLQIEEGSTATSYEPYITPSINVDGDEIYNQNMFNYSTTEQKIGTWIDGKPLYRKVIESTTFTTDFYPVSSNIKQFINQYGYVQRKDYTSIWQFIPSRVGNALGISFLNSTQDGGVQIDWGSSWQSNYANLFNKIVLIVEYTKTTD